MKKLMIFRNEDDGGSVPNGKLGASLMDDPTPEPSTEPTPTATPPTTPSAPTGTPALVDAGALAKQFGDVLGQHFKQQPTAQPQQPALTREEARKQLGLMGIDDEFLTRYDNLETRKQAMTDMYESLAAYATNLALAQANALREELRGEFAPARDFITQHQAEQKEKRFNEKYPTLAKKEYGPIISAVVSSLQGQKALTGNEDADFKLIADNMTAVLQQSNPNFQLATAPARPHGGIPSVSSGSGGGAGGGGGKTTKNPNGYKAVDLLS